MIFKKYLNKKFYLNLLSILSIFFFDRITKKIVISLDQENFGQSIFLSEYLNISLIWNQGVAFGLFSLDNIFTYNIFTFFICIVIFVIFIMLLKSNGFKKFSLILIFSGGIGNLYDRVFFKGVPDFLDFHIGEFHWFIFNIADIFITLGVIFMILFEIFDNKKTYE